MSKKTILILIFFVLFFKFLKNKQSDQPKDNGLPKDVKKYTFERNAKHCEISSTMGAFDTIIKALLKEQIAASKLKSILLKAPKFSVCLSSDQNQPCENQSESSNPFLVHIDSDFDLGSPKEKIDRLNKICRINTDYEFDVESDLKTAEEKKKKADNIKKENDGEIFCEQLINKKVLDQITFTIDIDYRFCDSKMFCESLTDYKEKADLCEINETLEIVKYCQICKE